MTKDYLFAEITRELERAEKNKYTGEITFSLSFNHGGLQRGRITQDRVMVPPAAAPESRGTFRPG